MEENKTVLSSAQDIDTGSEEIQIESDEHLLKSFDKGGRKMTGKSLKIVLGIFLMVVLGVSTGYFLSIRLNLTASGRETGVITNNSGGIEKGLLVGSQDESTFKDSAEGKLEKGGIDGEGSHHLVRPGGDSQTVYLTSSVLDLDLYDGREVQVWGQTFTAQTAGWLMDVGRLKVLD